VDRCSQDGAVTTPASSDFLGDERYRQMIERLPSGVIVHEQSGRIVFANRLASEIGGFANATELVGRHIGELLPPPFLKGLQGALVGGATLPERVRVDLTRVDGARVPIDVSETPYFAGGILCVQLSVTDVAAKVAAEGAIAATEARVRLLVDRIPGMVWSADREGRVLSWRGRLGFTEAEDWVGRPFLDLVGPGGAAAFVAHETALGGVSASCEIERGDRLLSIHLEPLIGPDGGIAGTVGLAADVTELKKAEALQRQNERLDALARLAGGVAHEVNNVLGAILAQASALVMDHPTSESALREELKSIVNAARRGGAVTANLLGFARGGMYRRDPLAVDTLVLDAALGARRRSKGNVEVEIDIVAQGMFVEGDAAQLRAALDAVCENALEASPSGGTIALRAGRIEIAPGDLPVPDLTPGAFVLIQVEDNGHSMTKTVLDRAFDPYFTTRTGEGRGLGLSMVHGVLRHHGGFARLTSTEGAGTQVSLYLPERTPRTAVPAGPLLPASTPPGPVLVVDDDDMMRMASCRLLERLGYATVDASDGPTALKYFSDRTRPFEFVLLDLRMPGMAGDEVLRRLVAIDPDVRIVICTGYDRDQVTQALFSRGRVGFLQKPFTPAALVDQIRFVRPESAPVEPTPG
jgi:PAS domain S-box-containing protein